GSVYWKGEGVPEDKAESLKWYRKAADQGDAEAQFILGVAYGNGEGVPEDYIQSYMWINLATAKNHDHEDAKKVKVLLSKKMTPEQIAEAQKLSTQWFERKAKEQKK
ncbi:sel1 repeat family protein, partial [Akkermansiaceae bacterium]|nr:sel1 repeat family protein [Akkermansiaceae bacterium]